MPLLTAEEEVILAKGMELGAQIEAEPEKAILSLHEWTLHRTEPTARAKDRRYVLPFEAESAPHRRRGDPLGRARWTCWSPRPSLGLADALKKAETDALKERLVRAQDLRSVYNERLDADTFLDLLNWIEGELGRPNAEIRASAALHALRDLGPRRGRLPGDPPPPRGGPRRRDRRRDGRRSSRSWPSCRATT